MAGPATTTTSCATPPICAFIIQSLQITIPNLRKSRDVLYAHLFHQSGSCYVFANQRSQFSKCCLKQTRINNFKQEHPNDSQSTTARDGTFDMPHQAAEINAQM